MLKSSNSKGWLSAYLYFKGNIYGQECDKILVQILKPFIKMCGESEYFEKYFFIRYGEWGSHVRLRFLGDEESMELNIKASLEKYIAEYQDQEIFAFPQIPKKQGFMKPLIWVPYEPELERYGGKYAMSTAEDFFFSSSVTALEILCRQNNLDHSNRLAKGLISMLILLFVFINDRNSAGIFIKQYSNGYLMNIAKEENNIQQLNNKFKVGFEKQSAALIEIIDKIYQALDNEYELQEPSGIIPRTGKKIKSSLKYLYDNSMIDFKVSVPGSISNVYNIILPSYIHMMNNRLGIPIIDESYISFLISCYFLSENNR